MNNTSNIEYKTSHNKLSNKFYKTYKFYYDFNHARNWEFNNPGEEHNPLKFYKFL
jgi:hypothetical protein